ncbi:MAG: hypothetical protein QF406_10585, partial [Verrucomicrobiota bacterium]|nr:hypothetical protein [Verrucomicrobiota bacterium]
MKKLPAAFALITLTLTLLYAAEKSQQVPNLTKEEHWKAYDGALKKGLPKTAIKHLDPIIKKTIAEEDYAEAIKAVGRKISLEGNIQGNKAQEKIRRMEAEIAKAPAEMKPMMTTVLANWYWHYFQQNRWRFIQRSRTNAAPGDDFETWDLPRI